MATLNWIGKEAVINHDKEVSFKLLKKVPTYSVGKNSKNLIVHGDNLEALKALMPFYQGKVKCIYIDPPYNTGNEGWVYNDKVNSPKIKDWLGKVVGPEAEDLTRHDKWLCMVYPRLKLLRDLLTEDGVIAVSIGDHEVHHLRIVLDELFKPTNFQGHIHWRRRHNQPNDATKMIGIVAEHVLVYTKDAIAYKKSGVGKVALTGKFSNPDKDPRGDWSTKPWKTGENQSGTRYRISTPSGKVYDEEWMGDENNFKMLLADNRIIFPKKGDGFPRKKYFKFERDEQGQAANNWWPHDIFGSNQEGTDEIKELFDGKIIFENPKPTKLIKAIINIANTRDGDIVLDSFAGTGTTAHAVMDLNNNGRNIPVHCS
jgi:adenine-specific DNA-methyltransferase